MSTIQFGGVISGLNTQGIIDALVAVKKQPLTELQSKEADLTSQKAAYSQVGTALDDLVTKVKLFTVTAAGASRVATSADPTVFTATAATSTPVSQYQVSVDRLATATRAASTTSMGAAVTGNVDTSLKLSNANLATPITTGNMTLTVDGTAVQFAVGDPTTTSLQTVMDGLAGALQSQLQMSDAGSTVSAAIVGGQLQLSISGNATGHDISFGDIGDTSNAAKALGLDVAVDEDLIETDFGAWEGKTFLEAAQHDPDLHGRWLRDTTLRPPGGESFDDVAHRIRRAQDRIVAAHPGETVLVVSHVTPIKTLLRLALDAGASILHRLHLDLASLSIAEFYPDGGSSVRLVNQTSYLS